MGYCLLTIPQFSVDAILLKEFTVRTCLSHLAILQHQDLVAIVDGPQSMGNKDARAPLLLQDTVDVLQQCLFGIRVEGRSLSYTYVRWLSSVERKLK